MMEEKNFRGPFGNYHVTRDSVDVSGGSSGGGGGSSSSSGGGGGGCFQGMLRKAGQVKDYLSETCCACVDTIPSFALVIMAVVLIMLLIAAIPLAFALTYMHPESRASGGSKGSIIPIRDPGVWPRPGEMIHDPNVLYQTDSILPPKVSGCKGFGFACTSNPAKVIGTFQRCDGVEDCEDGSDEMDCRECLTSFSCPASKGNGRQRKCLRGERLCDGVRDCQDNSDEDETHCGRSCKADEFSCESGDKCLSESMRCDGDEHCPDGSDESGCTECNNGAKMCALTGKCIPKWKLCDGVADCPDASDEIGCDCNSCSGSNKALCGGDQSKCILKKQVCDGNEDCPGGVDEQKCPGVCTIDKHALMPTASKKDKPSTPESELMQRNADLMVKCGDGVSLKWRVACDGLHPKCDANCKECNPTTAFTCASSENGPTCVHRYQVCDGNPDCGDGSDEAKCDCKAPGMIMCKSQDSIGRVRCYSEAQRCDGIRECPDGEDESGCESCKNGAFHCPKSKMCVSGEKRCDGVKDCPDLADELDCTCQECLAQPFPMYMCSTGDRCFRLSDVCKPHSQCPLNEKTGDKRDKLFCATRQGLSYF